ncbi:MAG TPA: hypothetical protein DCX53_06425 [Anaerolineae bacterium]|nr:hypothetical protein [Anaerolineae bacterium]
MKHKYVQIICVFSALILSVTSCNLPQQGGSVITPSAGETEPTAEPDGQPEPLPASPKVDRIKIRTVDGNAEFYDSGTDQKFIPRGVNYVDFYKNERGTYEDRVMATNVYDPERVREAFRHMHENGYNTVRIFFDTCGTGPYCIANPNGNGLNSGYLDNMADLMQIAGEEGIYIVFTANAIPEGGGYWQIFDQEFNSTGHEGFIDGRNADWIHSAGVKTKAAMWRDLMSGLMERNAVFEVVLGWQLTNEYWLWKQVPPLSLDSGMVAISNGQSYDMSDPDQKRQMVTDGTLHFIDTIVPIIKEYDPEALTTMGFFVPQFPNPTGVGGDWYVDTAPLMDTAQLDFWDFHAYFDTDFLDLEKNAENFGMVDYDEKPIIMGETAAGHAFVPSAQTTATMAIDWYAKSCEVGFDGWLYWGYYPWPADMVGKPWTLLEADEFLFDTLSPNNWEDPCSSVIELETKNISQNKLVRFSRELPESPARFAVDGGELEWTAGNFPPQWIEIDLGEPSTVGQVGFAVGQWPPGYTHHQVWARLSDGRFVLLSDFNGYTTVEMSLRHKLPVPVEDVVAVRFLQLESPSWAGYKEVEVISAPTPDETACFAKAIGSPKLMSYPSEDANVAGSLNANDEVYLDGIFTSDDGTEWAQVGGDAWVRAEALSKSDSCATSLTVLNEAPVRFVDVTLEVEVPASTEGDVFIGGFIPGTEYPSWIPWAFLLTKKSADVWSLTLDVPVGTTIEYVYTRGSFENIERPINCGETDPRMLVVGDAPVTQNDIVAKWRDKDCGG